MKGVQQELKRKLTESNEKFDTEVTEQIQKLQASLCIEMMNVETGKQDMAKMKEDMVMLEMQVAKAGNEKIVELLKQVIERKERFLSAWRLLLHPSSAALNYT